MSIRAQDHIAASTAVATVRPAFWDKFLSPKTDAPASATTSLGENFDSIDEHRALKG